MSKKYRFKNLMLFSLIIYFLLYLTNKFYSYEDLVFIGFTDHLKYLEIFNAAKNSTNAEVSQQQSYRFLIPYCLAKISNLFNFQNNFILFSVILILINLLIIYSFNKIIIYLNVKKNFSLIIISALIFNTYMFRPAIINPILLNDWLFTYGLILIANYIIQKKEGSFYVGLIFCSVTRQTSQVLNLVFLFVIVYSFIFKKKNNIKPYFYGLIINTSIFVILLIISTFYNNEDLNNNIYKSHILGLFYFNYTLIDLMTMILQFLNTYIFEVMLLIYLIAYFRHYKKFINFDVVLIGMMGLSIWTQPFLAGPNVTFGNISRLTVISLPVILIFFLYIFRNLEVKLVSTIFIILLLGISSLHHNYTYFFNFFFDYKNFHFGLINLLLKFLILAILLNNNHKFKILK